MHIYMMYTHFPVVVSVDFLRNLKQVGEEFIKWRRNCEFFVIEIIDKLKIARVFKTVLSSHIKNETVLCLLLKNFEFIIVVENCEIG